MIRIVDCPEEFFPGPPNSYPLHQGNEPLIEERALEYFSKSKVESEYIYIPIYWTYYHVGNGYGENAHVLQNFINELVDKHPNEKFFTVCQYASGTLTKIPNSKVFACSGTKFCKHWDHYKIDEIIKHETSEYIPIPLKCKDHPVSGNNTKYKAGFVGRLFTHSCRYKIVNKFSKLDGYAIYGSETIPQSQQINLFREVTSNSIFSFAPRGFGLTSFRLLEAIQMGSIPIYVSDDHWLPFKNRINWKDIALIVDESEIDSIPSMIDELIESGEYIKMKERMLKVYNEHLSWEGIFKNIEEDISGN